MTAAEKRRRQALAAENRAEVKRSAALKRARAAAAAARTPLPYTLHPKP